MTSLDGLMTVDWFFGLDLKTASFIIASLGVLHPMFYTCIFFIPMTYLLVTIWVLVVFYSGLSILLFYALLKNDEYSCRIWIWYALVFVVLMVALMYLHFIAVICKKRCNQMTVTVLGILWYMTTIYFILVVNSYRKTMVNQKTMTYVLTSAGQEQFWNTEKELNDSLNREKGAIQALKKIIDLTDNTVSRCKSNLSNLMSMLRDKQGAAKHQLKVSRENLRKETRKLMEILFLSDKLNETRKLINMTILSDIEKETKNLAEILDSFLYIPRIQHLTEKIQNMSTSVVKTTNLNLTNVTTAKPILEVNVFYLDPSSDDRDISSRVLLQDEEKKKKRQA